MLTKMTKSERNLPGFQLAIVSAMLRPSALDTLERDEHVHVARALLPECDEVLVLRSVVPGVERRHVRELDDDHALW